MTTRMKTAAATIGVQMLLLVTLNPWHGTWWFTTLMVACVVATLALCALDWLDLPRKHRERRTQPEPLDNGLTFRNARVVALDEHGQPTGRAWDLGSGNIGLAAPDEMAYRPVEYLRLWGHQRVTPQAVHGPWISARDILPPGECAIHGPEDMPLGGFYRLCGECGHVYATVQALVDEHNRLLQQMAAMPQPPVLPMPEFTPEELEQFKADLERAAQAEGRRYVPPAILAAITEPPKPWEPVEYLPLSYDQVDLITCCPFCTHDW